MNKRETWNSQSSGGNIHPINIEFKTTIITALWRMKWRISKVKAGRLIRKLLYFSKWKPRFGLGDNGEVKIRSLGHLLTNWTGDLKKYSNMNNYTVVPPWIYAFEYDLSILTPGLIIRFCFDQWSNKLVPSSRLKKHLCTATHILERAWASLQKDERLQGELSKGHLK